MNLTAANRYSIFLEKNIESKFIRFGSGINNINTKGAVSFTLTLRLLYSDARV